MKALLAQFIPEARDLLEQAGTGMLALERNAAAPGVINDVFRAVHTLKGSSGLFDVRPLTHLIHAAEDLLGELRVGTLALDSDIVDQLLDSLDVVSRWVDSLEASEALPPDAEAVTAARVTVLRQWLEPRRAEPTHAAAEPLSASSLPPPAWVLALPDAQRLAIVGQAQHDGLIAWTFIPEDDCFFRGDDPLAMVRQSPGMITVRVLPREPLSIQTIDPLTSLLQFEVLSDTTLALLEEHLRYVMDAVEWRVLATESLAVASGSVAKGPVFAEFSRLARQHLIAGAEPALSRSLDSLMRMIAPDSIQASALCWCSAEIAKHGLTRPDRIARWIQVIETGAMADVAAAAPSRAEDPRPAIVTAHHDLAREIARTQLDMLATAGAPGLEGGRLEAAGTVMRRLVQALSDDRWSAPLEAALRDARAQRSPDPLRAFVAAMSEDPLVPVPLAAATPVPVPVPAVPAAAEPPLAEPSGENRTAPRVLRVDQTKIDAIMNLVAELIVAKNGLSYLATRAEQVHGSRAAAREIKDQFAVIDRITQGLQVGVMSVRMMPVSQVFQRFPRLVRDIARKLGKTIELVIEGEDTEADKNVLESLADPLIHMVRNSLDHGIETPEERRAAGKTDGGTLRISARQESDFVVIEVADDGRGIDPEVVKAKALAQGLISSEQAVAMDDVEAANLVFAAGFSTKDTVSDLSGRGVGMDVVRSAVTKAGGAVALQSRFGHGTTVTVRLPLTMAVTRIVTIACRDRLFGIPMDLVVETVKIQREQIHRIKEAETFVLRESVVPLVRLDTVLGLSQRGDSEPDEEAVMVVKIGRDRIGLVVDGFRERLEVIVKPLDGLLEGLPYFSGTALLGDGRVLLILDPQEALSCR